MAEDRGDPFREDAAAQDREQRRREREERRHRRLGRRVQKASGSEAEPRAEAAEAAPRPESEPDSAPPAARRPDSDFADAPPVEPRTPWQARRPPEASPAVKRSYWRRRIAILVVVALLVVAGVFGVLLYQPFHGKGHGRVTVKIPKGATASETADILDGKGVVSNATFFRLRLSMSGKAGDIQAGTYTLLHDMSYGDAIDKLQVPPVPKIITVTVPEGYDRTQTADLVKQDGLPGDYLASTKSFKGFDPSKYGVRNPVDLEGFLFPATYTLKRGSNVDDLVAQQLAAFKQNLGRVDLSYARSKNLTPYDVLIIASMIERESATASDRPKVAAVIYNRLKQGIPLGIDATIRFVLHDYTHALTASDLAINSPYNTRTNAGLPPGPISNPGLASLKAAAKPANVPYLYYVTRPGACGKLSFATTDAQFQQLVNQYNSARQAAGGKSPTSC